MSEGDDIEHDLDRKTLEAQVHTWSKKGNVQIIAWDGRSEGSQRRKDATDATRSLVFIRRLHLLNLQLMSLDRPQGKILGKVR